MSGWIRKLRDRPIADGERHTALALAALTLAAAVAVLVLTAPIQRSPTAAIPIPRSAATLAPRMRHATPVLSPTVEDAARVFLKGYLAYVYGHGPVSAIRDATPALLGSLRAYPPRVSPATRTRDPRVLALHPGEAPAALVGVSALINDGGLIDYQIALLLTPNHAQPLISRVKSE